MYKKSFYLAAVFSTALFAACQHEPALVNSTWHKPGEGGNLSRSNSMNKANGNYDAMKASNADQNTIIRPETNRSESNVTPNAKSKP